MAETKNNQVLNLFNALREDENSVFYVTDQITESLINKAKKSPYAKDKVFVNIYNELENKNFISSESLPLMTPFISQRKDADKSTFYSFKSPFEALQADIADIQFLGKSAVDPHYCLLFVGLFTNMICTYPMRKRKQLAEGR